MRKQTVTMPRVTFVRCHWAAQQQYSLHDATVGYTETAHMPLWAVQHKNMHNAIALLLLPLLLLPQSLLSAATPAAIPATAAATAAAMLKHAN